MLYRELRSYNDTLIPYLRSIEVRRRNQSMNFTNLRVLEVGGDPAVAFCGLQLARWGAEVTVDGRSIGDLQRLAPLFNGVSLTWKYLTTNKVILDDVPIDVVATADVLLTDLDRSALQAKGIHVGADTIFHRVVPFARGGSYTDRPGAPILFEAASGFLSINGEPNREPLRMPANLIPYIAGSHACVATLAALFKRLRTGNVESIETAQLDAIATTVPFVRSEYQNRPERRHGGPATGVKLYSIGDGKVSGNLSDASTFAGLCAELGIDEAVVPLEFRTPAGRADHSKLDAFLLSRSAHADAEAVFEGVLNRGVQRFGLFLKLKQLFTNRQLKALSYFKPVDDHDLGTLQWPGLPARVDGLDPPETGPARHVKRFRWGKERLPSKRSGGSLTPLAGVRVIDFTQAWIGPYATMLLADFGADVIKVESHRRVDVWRNWRGELPARGLVSEDAHPLNISPNFNSTNRNKREIAIDLNNVNARPVVRDLVASADLVMSNFTPRVMQKFNLDFDSLRAIKRDIVNVVWSGYGDVGPYRDYKANGATIEAICGWDALFGYRDREPMVMGFYQTDAFTGLHMAITALIALINRDLTHEAQNVRGSMIEAAIGYIGEEVLAAGLGHPTKRLGNRHPNFAPYGVFETADVDQWVAIACCTDADWLHLKRVLGLDTSTFDSTDARLAHVDELEELVNRWTRRQSKRKIVEVLRHASVPAAAVVDSLEVLSDEEFQRRGWFQRQFHADIGDHWQGGFAWRFSNSQLTARLPSPRLGEHTTEILKSLGYSDMRIAALFDEDAVGCVLNRSDVRTIDT